MSNISIGSAAYRKPVPGAFGDAVMRKLGEDLRTSLVRHLGIDPLNPTDEVRPGDRVVLPGGHEEDVEEDGGSSSDLEDLRDTVGGCSDEEGLEAVTGRASALRERLGGALQKMTGDGCDDLKSGIEVVCEIAEAYASREDVEGDSIKEFINEAPDQRQLCELFTELGVDWEMIGDMRQSQALALEAARRDIPTPESVGELCGMLGISPKEGGPRQCVILAIDAAKKLRDSENERAERLFAVQDRVESLMRRLTGECGEGLRVETMLDRIEQALGPVPEF